MASFKRSLAAIAALLVALPFQNCSPRTGQTATGSVYGGLAPNRAMASVTGAPWSGILAPSRAVDWSGAGLPATLPDGETTLNPWTPPARTQCGATIAAGSSAATINAALAACPPGHFVLLGPGTFTLSNASITMYNQNGVTLRGSGAGVTTLSLTGNSQIQFGITWALGTANWTSGFSPGTTSITISSLNGPALVPGTLLTLQQCDTGYSGPTCSTGAAVDNGALFICGDNPACIIPGEGQTTSFNHQTQTVYVTSVTGTGPYTVNFTPGLYMPNWNSANSPTVSWVSSSASGNTPTPYGNGLEDLTVLATNVSANSDVDLSRTYGSWVKGVRFLGSGLYLTLSVSNTKNALVANNYFFSDIALDGDYPPAMQEGSGSDNLVMNNIMASGVPWEGTGSSQGNVVAFNYGRDTFTAYVENQFFEHNAGSAFYLYEGNQAAGMTDDVTHGTHNLNTWFRNYLSGEDAPYQSINPRGVTIDSFARFENVVGNAIGGPRLTVYESALNGYGYVYQFGGGAFNDALAKSTSMRWGNCDSATSTCRFASTEVPTSLSGNASSLTNAVPATNSLPASFFINGMTAHPSGGTGLSWWKVCTNWSSFPSSCSNSQTQPFPVAGPDISGGSYVNGHAYDIPAAVAWKTLPVDPAFQHTYSITGSSWSNGVETLTISGLPDTTHLLGGFQITGTAGCNSPSGGEFMITNSTSTTVSYALASDPGSCAGGTFKFPDVRMFDEKVYQQDGSVTSPAPTPTPAPTPVPVATATPVPAPVGSGTSAVVQSNSNAASSNSASVSFNTTNNAGDLILVQAVWVGTSSVSSVTDSLGNTYQAATAMQVSPGGNSQQIFYAKNIAGGSNTVTVTTASSSLVILFVQEFSGIDAVNPIDVTASATGSGSAVSSGGATTHYSNEILFGGIESDGNIQSAGSGYASLGVLYGNLAEYAIGSSAGSFAATGTNDSSGWIAQLIALKPAGTTSTAPAPTPTPTPTPIPVTATPTPTPAPAGSTDVVTVTQSPSGNVTLSTAYLTIKASASSNTGRVITGWHIYVDGVNVYGAGQTSSISTTLKFSRGTHTVVTRAWDSAGTYGSYSITVKR